MRALVIWSCITVAAGPALADDKADKEKAKQLYEEGLRRYNLAEYKEAIAAWKESYLLSKAPLLLFNIGQAFRLSGDCTQAMRFYDNYKREAPNPKNKAELENAVKLCASAPKTEPVKTEPVKTEPVKTEPAKTEPVKTEPAKTEPVKTEPVKQELQTEPTKAEPKVTASTDLAPPDDGGPTDTPPAARGKGLKLAGVGVGGAGVALGGLGIFFALKSGKASSDLDGYTGEWGPAQVARERDGKAYARKAVLFGAIGAGAIVTGGVLYFLGNRAAHKTESVALVPTGDGLELTYLTRF